jgi:hypothetical protein
MLCERGDELDADVPNADYGNEWGFGFRHGNGALSASIVEVGFADIFRRWCISGQRATADGAPDVLSMLEMLQARNRAAFQGALKKVVKIFGQLRNRGTAKAISGSWGCWVALVGEMAHRVGHAE